MRFMKRFKLVVAYDGTNYCGWQIQPNGITIEEVLNQKLSKLTGEKITVIGASRTDSGVHARANIAVFDTESTIPPDRIAIALNQKLPESEARKVSEALGELAARPVPLEPQESLTDLGTVTAPINTITYVPGVVEMTAEQGEEQ